MTCLEQARRDNRKHQTGTWQVRECKVSYNRMIEQRQACRPPPQSDGWGHYGNQIQVQVNADAAHGESIQVQCDASNSTSTDSPQSTVAVIVVQIP